MKLVIKILYKIVIFILIMILLLVAYNFINLKVLKNDYTNYFGYTIFEVASGSMKPTIIENDVILVKINDKIELDDIITYKKDDSYITHRVVDIQGDYYICRGDANNTNDDPVSKNMVLGKVIKLLPQIGVWKKVMTTPKVFISILITILLFSIGFAYKKTNKFTDFSISRKRIIDEYGDKNE